MNKFLLNVISKIPYLNKKFLPHAVCVFVANKEGKILAVPRKNNPNDFGFPGGRVEKNETELDAIFRELFEETGILLIPSTFKKVFEDIDECGYWITGFMVSCHPELGLPQEGEPLPQWVDKNILLNGSFKKYNTKFLRKIDQELKNV